MKPTTQTLEDELTHPEPSYESPAHAEIGRMLDRYGIPFFYRQRTLVLDGYEHRTVHPAFTLPDYAGMVIDYAGPLDQRQTGLLPVDQPGTRIATRPGQDIYHRNGVPVVYIQPADMEVPSWDRLLHERILEAYEQSLRQTDMVTPYR